MLFKTLATHWLKDQKLRCKPRTFIESKHRAEVLCRKLGDRNPVQQSDIDGFMKYRRKRVRVATVNGDLKVLRAILTWGRKHGLSTYVPEVKLLPAPVKLPKTYSREEINALLRACEGRLRIFVLIVRFTLARHQEVLGLQFGDIDYDTGAVKIRSPKGHRERVVFVPDEVLEETARYRRTLWYKEDSDYIFQSQKRRRQKVGTLHKPLREAFQRAGIYRPGIPTTHGLRHSGASELIRTTDIYTLAEIMGHRDVQTTLIYLHTTDARKKEAIEALK